MFSYTWFDQNRIFVAKQIPKLSCFFQLGWPKQEHHLRLWISMDLSRTSERPQRTVSRKCAICWVMVSIWFFMVGRQVGEMIYESSWKLKLPWKDLERWWFGHGLYCCSRHHWCVLICSFSNTSLVVHPSQQLYSLPPSRPWKRYACNGIQISNLASQGATMVIYGPIVYKERANLEVWIVMWCLYNLYAYICVSIYICIDYIEHVFWFLYVYSCFICLFIYMFPKFAFGEIKETQSPYNHQMQSNATPQSQVVPIIGFHDTNTQLGGGFT